MHGSEASDAPAWTLVALGRARWALVNESERTALYVVVQPHASVTVHSPASWWATVDRVRPGESIEFIARVTSGRAAAVEVGWVDADDGRQHTAHVEFPE